MLGPAPAHSASKFPVPPGTPLARQHNLDLWHSCFKGLCTYSFLCKSLRSPKISSVPGLEGKSTRLTWINELGFWPAMKNTFSPQCLQTSHLKYLKCGCLSLSTVKVHLIAISASHPLMEGQSVFFHLTVLKFPKSLTKIFSPAQALVPPEPKLILTAFLSQWPPIYYCLWRLICKGGLSSVCAFTKSEGEIPALMEDFVVLKFPGRGLSPNSLHVSYPKLPQNFILVRISPSPFKPFFPKSQKQRHFCLCLTWGESCSFYVHRTKLFQKSLQLFLFITGRSKGTVIFASKVSN